MRHRVAHRHLSRPSEHRLMMLRNLVSSLLEHQQISTTVAKAKETQPLVEKVIGWGKEGGKKNFLKAQSYLLNPSRTLAPLFTTYASRYALRPGGYTRIHRAGHRIGDNAPVAIIQLVDSPNDLTFEHAAKTIGRELSLQAKATGYKGTWPEFSRKVATGTPQEIMSKLETAEELEARTRRKAIKALQFRHMTDKYLEDIEDSNKAVSGPRRVVPATADSEAEASPSVRLFFDRAYYHYMQNLAKSSLSSEETNSASDDHRKKIQGGDRGPIGIAKGFVQRYQKYRQRKMSA